MDSLPILGVIALTLGVGLLLLLVTSEPKRVDSPERATRERRVEHYRRGLELGDKAEWRKAITEFDRVIDLDPNHGAAYTQRGFAYAELGKTDKAIADFENALSRTRDPKAIAYIEAEIKQLREGK
ncbi:MAG: tetratricopeptide repeat protein [Nitrospiraceae bacterium]